MNASDFLDHQQLVATGSPGLHIMREADVFRRMFGVPNQLLGKQMLGIEMQIAEQALAGTNFDAANHADPLLIVARRQAGFPWDD